MVGLVMSIFNFRHWLRLSPKDWFLRFVSLGMAIVLWSFVGGEDIVNKNVMVPIEIINLPRDLVISNQFKKEIEVSVSGPRSLLFDMENRSISRPVDLSNATPGTMVLENTNDVINVPRGVKVLGIQPKSVILSLDKMIHKKFDVNPVTEGTIAQDYVLENIRMEPASISITGPRTVLSQFEVLKTKPIHVGGLRESTQIQIPLDLDPVIIDLIGATTVTADIEIAVERVNKKISAIPIEVVKDGIDQRVTPSTVAITAAFPKTLLREKRDLRSLFKATVRGGEGDGQMQVVVVPDEEFSPEIRVLKIEPQVVTLIEETAAPAKSEEDLQ